MRFYELTNEIKELEQMFLEQIDTETGEIKDAKALEELDNEVKDALKNKTENIIQSLKIQEAYLLELQEELKNFQEFIKKKEKQHENYKKYLIRNLKELGTKKIETPIGNLSYNESFVTDVYDTAAVPEVFKSIEVKTTETLKVDKQEIKKLLKKGVEIPGARLIINNNLLVK